ncbi:MAG: hypothetical protein HYZ47_02215 [Simkania negevensis]|nr:hypothetical protein [Simkania negevensis]
MSAINLYMQRVGDRLADCFLKPPVLAKPVEKKKDEGKEEQESDRSSITSLTRSPPSLPSAEVAKKKTKLKLPKPLSVSIAALDTCWTEEMKTIQFATAIFAVFTTFTGGACYVLIGLPWKISTLGKILLVVPTALGGCTLTLYGVVQEMEIVRYKLQGQKTNEITFTHFMSLFQTSVNNVKVHERLLGFLLNKELEQLPTYVQAKVGKETVQWEENTRIVALGRICTKWLPLSRLNLS